MKLSALKTNVAVLEQGRWVEDIPNTEGLKLRVRGLGNSDYKRLYLKKSMAVPRKDKVRGLTPKDNDRIVAECVQESVLLDWKGLLDEDGAEIPFSADFARDLICNPEYANFYDAVVWAANVVANEASASGEADAGN